MSRSSWHRPQSDVVGFYPYSPGGKLAKQIQAIVTEETARLGMTAKIVETGGRSIKSQLVSLDLTGCVYKEMCPICASQSSGASHTRSGALYSGTCQICMKDGKVARYWGESGNSAQVRTTQHVEAIGRKEKSNAFHKHLEIFHPENVGDKTAFKFKSEQTFKKSLERQVTEGVKISNDNADILLNSRAEYHQPALHRVMITRQRDEPQWVSGGSLNTVPRTTAGR